MAVGRVRRPLTDVRTKQRVGGTAVDRVEQDAWAVVGAERIWRVHGEQAGMARIRAEPSVGRCHEVRELRLPRRSCEHTRRVFGLPEVDGVDVLVRVRIRSRVAVLPVPHRSVQRNGVHADLLRNTGGRQLRPHPLVEVSRRDDGPVRHRPADETGRVDRIRRRGAIRERREVGLLGVVGTPHAPHA